MKKSVLTIFAIFLISIAYPQQYGYKWRFGVSAGTTNYFGDIRPLGVRNFGEFSKLYRRYKTYSPNLSYQFSIEYALGKSVGLMLTGGAYQFGSSDRFIKNDGTLYTESPRFDRALNFQTDLWDTGLSFVIKPDNNWLLSGKSFFAPYLVLGFGYQYFNVYGDLLDAQGNRYDYSNPGIIPDGVFETSLREVETEIPGGYDRFSMYTHIGLGFRFRIAKGIEIFAQSDFKRAATDYLDDVSGQYRTRYDNNFQAYAAKPGTNVVTPENPYRGFESGNPDWYIYHGIGVKFSLGARKESFNPPVITQRYTFVPDELTKKQLEAADSARLQSRPTSTVNNYFTVIQLPSWGKNQQIPTDSMTLDSAALANREVVLDSLELQRGLIQREMLQTQNRIAEIDQTIELAERDTTVSAEVTEARLSSLREERTLANESLTRLSLEESLAIYTMDSLNSYSAEPEVATMDSAALTKELIIIPGQIGRIMYSEQGQTKVYMDSSAVSKSRSVSDDPNMMTREEFEEEMDRFRSEMLQAQAKRDSAMIMAFASKIPEPSEYEQPASEPQEVLINTEAVDEKTAKKLEKNRKKQEKLDKKNNELLKDALLVGGTAATTAAIANSGDKKEAAAQAQRDSLLMAQIQQDSLMIDSLQQVILSQNLLADSLATESNPDSVLITKTVPSPILVNHSKIEIYFEVNEITLSPSERTKLDEVKTFLDQNENISVELVGFADNTGSISYNLRLSERRVEAVKAALQEIGVPESKISTNVGGLIVRGGNKDSNSLDRKVEIRFSQIEN